jgi:hypothetical protein
MAFARFNLKNLRGRADEATTSAPEVLVVLSGLPAGG